MRISTREPEWGQFSDSHVYAGKEQRVLGRVDFIASLGYWWQTADHTGVCISLQEAQRRVENALQSASRAVAALPSQTNAGNAA